MRWPYNRCETFYVIFYSCFLPYYVINQWSRYDDCAAPIQIFTIASPIVFFLITNIAILLQASDLPDWARKLLTCLFNFVLAPLGVYLPVQGLIWQIINMKESPECASVKFSAFMTWSWIFFMTITGILLGITLYFKLRNWWRIRQFRNQMRRVNHLASEEDLNVLSELLLANGDINDQVGLLPSEVEKLETKDFSRSFVDMITGSENQTCPICVEDYKTGDKIILLPKCGHAFHPECVERWLLKTPLCPVCRGNVRTGMYDRAAQNQDLENPAN